MKKKARTIKRKEKENLEKRYKNRKKNREKTKAILKMKRSEKKGRTEKQKNRQNAKITKRQQDNNRKEKRERIQVYLLSGRGPWSVKTEEGMVFNARLPEALARPVGAKVET